LLLAYTNVNKERRLKTKTSLTRSLRTPRPTHGCYSLVAMGKIKAQSQSINQHLLTSQYSTIVLTVVRVMIAKYRK